MSNFSKVGTFMKTFGQEVKTEPSFSTDKINKLRIDLIKEELEELTDAMSKNDLLEVAPEAKTVPQIFINGESIGGCDELYELESKNELNELIGIRN